MNLDIQEFWRFAVGQDWGSEDVSSYTTLMAKCHTCPAFVLEPLLRKVEISDFNDFLIKLFHKHKWAFEEGPNIAITRVYCPDCLKKSRLLENA